MAPTPPIPPPEHKVPKLHLEILDLSEPGASKFLSQGGTPFNLLNESSRAVLRHLYPPTLTDQAGTTSDDEVAPEEFESGTAGASHDAKLPGPPPIRSVTLHIRSMGGVAYTQSIPLDEQHKEIHFSSDYIDGVRSPDPDQVPDSKRIADEIRGVLVHELTHVFQYDGKGTVPGGVIEGIADVVRQKEGLEPPHWKRGTGDKWDEGYQTTAYFFLWLEGRFKNPLLIAQLNLTMRKHRWDDGKWFKELCQGEDVEELWKEYKKSFEKADESTTQPPKPVPTHVPRN